MKTYEMSQLTVRYIFRVTVKGTIKAPLEITLSKIISLSNKLRQSNISVVN